MAPLRAPLGAHAQAHALFSRYYSAHHHELSDIHKVFHSFLTFFNITGELFPPSMNFLPPITPFIPLHKSVRKFSASNSTASSSMTPFFLSFGARESPRALFPLRPVLTAVPRTGRLPFPSPFPK